MAIEGWLSGSGKGPADMDLETPGDHCPIDESHPAAGEKK